MKHIIILFFLLPVTLLSQINAERLIKVDSIRQVITTAEQDTAKLNAWMDLAQMYRRYAEMDSSQYHFDQIIQYCLAVFQNQEVNLTDESKKKYYFYLSDANFWKGYDLENQEEHEKALDAYTNCIDYGRLAEYDDNIGWGLTQKAGLLKKMGKETEVLLLIEDAEALAKASKDTSLMHETAFSFYRYYYMHSEHSNAITFAENMYVFAEALRDTTKMADALSYIGASSENTGNFERAATALFAALQIHEQTGNPERAWVLNSIGLLNYRQDEYEDAITYFKKAVPVFDSNKNQSGLAAVYNNMGNAYLDLDVLDSALIYYEQAYEMNEKRGNIKELAGNIINIGVIHNKKEQYVEAISYFERGVAMKDKVQYKQFIGIGYREMGIAYRELGQYAKAIESLNKSKALSIDLLPQLKNLEFAFYETYEQMGNAKQALSHYEAYIEIRDSLDRQENQRALIEQEAKYTYTKKIVADSVRNIEVQKVKDIELAKSRQATYFLWSGLGLSLLLIGFIFNRFRVTRCQKRIIQQQKQEVDKAYDQSERLLLNILPKETAEELKTKGSVAAQVFDQATVLFTDFKDFTKLASSMSPEALVAELDHCFSAFDRIMATHGIEKIKTIGDSYMAVSGIPQAKANHAEAAVRAAIAMQDYMTQRAQQRQAQNLPYFEMRIGLHSGSLIAGVVGENKFQYDVWGDSVNIASRLENAGEPGKVNISEDTYAIIQSLPAFQFSSRGEVEVKGKGGIAMYFVSLSGE